MKTINLFKICILLVLLFAVNYVYSQGNTFKLDGNNNGTSTNKLGWKNNADLKIVTNDSARIIVKNDGNVEIMKDLKINGHISSENIFFNTLSIDKLHINQFLNADSIHSSFIKVGNNSIMLGTTSGPWGITNDINTDFGDLFIQSNITSNFHTILNANGNTGNVGIGTSAPAFKLDVIDDITVRPPFANQGYRINDDVVLQNWGTDNIFVGVGAGAENLATIHFCS